MTTNSGLCSVEAEGAAGAGADGGAGGAGAAGAEGAAGGAGGANGAGAPFYESFKSEAVRTSPSVQLFKDPEALAEGYINLEKRLGVDPKLRIELPADPKDAAAMRAVWTKLGLPEKPEGYGMGFEALPPTATEADKTERAADEAMLGKFVAKAHELGLPSDMAKGLLGFWMERVAEAKAGEAADITARAEAGTKTLKTEWGEAFEQRTREIGNLLAKYAPPALIPELDGAKLGSYPNLAIFLGKMVERMAEPGVAGGAAGDQVNRPGVLTPAQATAEARKLETHPALRDKSHPQHDAVTAERNRLLVMADQRTEEAA